MAEIKSTLELAMERTRHLAMSEEEKAQQKQTDFRKRFQGLLQQYEDGAVMVEAFKKRMSALQKEFNVTSPKIVIEGILDRLDPAAENQRWLALLTLLAPPACATVESALAAYRTSEAEIRQSIEQATVERLDREHGISGSAIVANPAKAPRYQKALTTLRREFQTTVKEISHQMGTS